MITTTLLDELWDFGDVAASEQRFAEAAASELFSAAERVELITQQARALGLQGRFGEAHALLDRLGEVSDAVVQTRIALETGRLHSGAGDRVEAVAFFEDALMIAQDAGLEFLAVDAMHMLAATDLARSEQWAERGITMAAASADPRTQRWLVSLHGDIGASRLEAGQAHAALRALLEAARWAELVGTPQQRTRAAEAVAECEAVLRGE